MYISLPMVNRSFVLFFCIGAEIDGVRATRGSGVRVIFYGLAYFVAQLYYFFFIYNITVSHAVRQRRYLLAQCSNAGINIESFIDLAPSSIPAAWFEDSAAMTGMVDSAPRDASSLFPLNNCRSLSNKTNHLGRIYCLRNHCRAWQMLVVQNVYSG